MKISPRLHRCSSWRINENIESIPIAWRTVSLGDLPILFRHTGKVQLAVILPPLCIDDFNCQLGQFRSSRAINGARLNNALIKRDPISDNSPAFYHPSIPYRGIFLAIKCSYSKDVQNTCIFWSICWGICCKWIIPSSSGYRTPPCNYHYIIVTIVAFTYDVHEVVTRRWSRRCVVRPRWFRCQPTSGRRPLWRQCSAIPIVHYETCRSSPWSLWSISILVNRRPVEWPSIWFCTSCCCSWSAKMFKQRKSLILGWYLWIINDHNSLE